ncbi:tetratricopeptide repeat protein [Kitasatospora phosalacinea]|uniref:tetratricopeptide repeat protein n=1 Tax=Kitasatospora phosalacinea TaxID=2065 RepID=UPI00068B9191|nr:tetratricopeptide repeat protein [Kitasatospora phosalacinea]
MTWSRTRNEISGGHFHGAVHQADTVNFAAPRTPRPTLGGLPPGTGRFVGREAESALLDAVLARDGGGAVVAVVGPPGVGKTELVVQAARRSGAPALFADLAGYDPERRLAPAEVLDGFLRALGLPPEDIPPGLQDKSRAYRSLLAEPGPPVLVVLDNAFGAEQITPLLPGGHRANTLITSRHTLGVDARLVELAVLDEPSAVRLLDSALRAARPEDTRLARHPSDAAELARLCEGLPLALRIAAALLADTPARPPSSLAAALRDERTRLRRLRHRELAVRAAFALSYAHLTPDAARVFRLFALNPGPDLASPTVAAAVRLDGPDAEELLAELAQAHLVEAGERWGRWRMHDLMRLFAAEQERDEEVQDRLHAHYLGLAEDELEPERRNLVALAVAEPPLGRPGTTRRLVDLLLPFLRGTRRYDDALAVLDAGLADARRGREASEAALLLHRRGDVLWEAGRHGRAEADLREAAGALAGTEPGIVRAGVLASLGGLLNECGRYREAEEVLSRARRLVAGASGRAADLAADLELRRGVALNGTGRHLEAFEVLRALAEERRAKGDLAGLVEVLSRQRECLISLGRIEEAVAAGRGSAALSAVAGDRIGQVHLLTDLGSNLTRAGEGERALDVFREALALAERDGGYPLMAVRSELAVVLAESGRPEEALGHADAALETALALGGPQDRALVRCNRALVLERAGRSEQAIAEFRAAATAFEELTNVQGQLWALRCQVWALDRAGRHREAEAVRARIAGLRPPAP